MSSKTATLEALLFASGEPLTTEKIAEIMELTESDTTNLLACLDEELKSRGIVLREVAGGWQLSTRPEYFDVIGKLSKVTIQKLSASMMETLSIIAYLQPVTKIDIEQIRGVKSDKLVSKLIDLALVDEVGRKEVIGRPILYGTTEVFLKLFGLKSLNDLPAADLESVSK